MVELSIRAKEYVKLAIDARERYLETQAARWIILAEQGEVESARQLDSEVLALVFRAVWTLVRGEVNRSIRVMQAKREYLDSECPGWALQKLSPYLEWEQYWRTTSELLREEVATHLASYERFITAIIATDGSTSTPLRLQEALIDLGIEANLKLHPDIDGGEGILA